MATAEYCRLAVRTMIVLLFSLFMGVVVGCLPDDCEGIGPYYTTVEEITSTNIRFTDGQSPNDALVQNDTVAYSEYAISTDISSSAVAVDAESNGSWVSSAYACDPVPILVDTLVGITVSSDTDYISTQDTIAAQEVLNAYLSIGFNSVSVFESLTSYPQARSRLAYGSSFIVKFSEAPGTPQTHKFTIHYELADGRVLSSTTDPVTIAP